MNWIAEANVIAIFGSIASFIASWSISKEKIRQLEEKIRNFEELKIEAKLVGIQTELKHIRALLEKS